MPLSQPGRDEQLHQRLPEHLGSGPAEDLLGGGVELDDAPLVVHGDHRVESGLEYRRLPGLTLPDGLLGPFPVGDVSHHDLDRGLPIQVERRAGDFDLHGGTVHSDELLFHRRDGLSLTKPLEAGEDQRAGVGVDEAQDRVPDQRVGRGDSEEPGRRLVRQGDDSVLVYEDRVRRGVDRLVVPIL